MAHGTQQRLYLTLAKLYTSAVQEGLETVDIHIDWIAETLEYLDGKDISERKVFLPLDDWTQEDWEKYVTNQQDLPTEGPDETDGAIC